MLRFSASAIECFSEFEEVLTVHFDNQADHYLTLQVWTEKFEENAQGMGMVHVEVDDQLNSGYDCFTSAELRRDSFRMTFTDREERLARLKELEVTFDMGTEKYERLRWELARVFRRFKGYRVVDE